MFYYSQAVRRFCYAMIFIATRLNEQTKQAVLAELNQSKIGFEMQNYYSSK
jgi:hypothetical protein